MTASVIRQDRFGDPASAFQQEVVDTPRLGPGEVLVAVMAAGINYNNVWAARGYPVDQVAAGNKRGESEDFHIGGSDLSGIVYAVGDQVEGLSVGDHVITRPGYWDGNDPWVLSGKYPMIRPSARICAALVDRDHLPVWSPSRFRDIDSRGSATWPRGPSSPLKEVSNR